MNLTDVVTGLVILLGLVGVAVPLLPGVFLIAVAVVVWAAVVGGPVVWTAAGVAVAVLLVGAVVKYVVPGRRLAEAGVPRRTLVAGGLAALVGFFVIPVVGLFLGFVAGVYLSERQRVGTGEAWPATVAALRAVGLSILIELGSGLVAAGVWLTGALLT